jgi:23S rRNA pseudouridine1911/1915/1917 synthase
VLAERLVTGGAVLVDGKRRPKSHRLAGGEHIDVELPAARALVPIELSLAVVHEDEQLLVVDKPAGLVAHPAGPDERATLAHGLLALGAAGGDPERPGLVHRLDRDTSGLLVVARSEEAHARLAEAIRERRVERHYLALVVGSPRSRTGRIEAPIGRDRRDRTRRSLDTETPRDAVTWFEVQEILGRRALLEVRLETGRTHQIRVHLEAIDLPVCGDPVYGVAGDLLLERQFLHAHRLRFEHPFTGAELDLSSPLPPDLAGALDRARAA